MVLKPHGDAIRHLTQTSSKNYSQAVDFLAAARAFLSDSYRIELGCVDISKLSAYVQRFAGKNLPRLNREAQERSRFLSSISCDGLQTLHDTASRLCENVFFIQDDYGAVSSLFLNTLRSCALELGHDVIVCYCSLYPHSKIDHLLIPDAGIAFLTENRFHSLSGLEPSRRIHAKRFLDCDRLHLRKKRLSFNQKAAEQLLDQAVGVLRETKGLHDQLEALYQEAMDFSSMDELLCSVTGNILRFQMQREGLS